MDIGELRKLFPVTQDRVYLNHASVSPPSLRVQEAVGKIVADIGRRGVPGYFDWTEFAETEAKSRFARFIGAEREEIAFLKNTTEGIAIVATGLDWSPGDNVVSAAIEFPSNALQWVNLKDLGVETRFVPARDGRVPIEDIERQMDDRTRV
ncbi:MAG TPA: aminotransferase class V-fold PLP-dependent enzyme, partial [Nitrospinota bacterium]|nr:aminotransferase class V-fold PLP-dependent enzyme [Nitrospinota bacterium]